MMTMYSIRRCAAALIACLALAGAAQAADPPSNAPEVTAKDLDQVFRRSTIQIATPDARLHRFNSWIADDDQRRARGLMFIRELRPDDSMLFIYSQPQPVAMWMKNTYVPLDMLFVAPDGWLGWDTNLGPSVDMIRTAALASGSTLANVHGFITNTANTSALQEPYIVVDNTTRPSRWIDWNQFNDELTYAQAFRQRAIQAGFDANIGMLIDTSRNGWGGPNRPTGPSTAADLNTRIDASRVDRRIHKGNWCNPSGAGLGERPRAAPAAGIDAYVWIKPPGESDGASQEIPNDEGKGFDRMCDPTYGGNPRNNNNMTGALPNAPLSGHWFPAQFQQLLQNAYPPL